MDETEVALTTALRLQPAALQAIHHAQAQAQSHRGIPAASHLTPELQALDREESNAIQQRINDTGNVRHFHHPAVFDHSHIRRLPTQGQHHSLQQPQQHNQRLLQQHQHLNQRQNIGGQFGVLTPTTPLISVPLSSNSPAVPAQEDHEYLTAEQPKRDGHNDHMKFIPNPPDLEMWRNRLFNVDEMITLTEEEYQTYFPHVDNVYSHRSTQRYKRKSFVSHYWDCRLKGRPPGTPKSDDPNKRKRKRNARQRDLCDVKIKVTEYFSSSVQTQGFSPDTDSRRHEDNNTNFLVPSQPGETPPGPVQPFGVLKPSEANSPANIRVGPGQRYYTIQRVNGNGGNGKGDGASGPHKHTLEDSDRVKKSSIQRGLLHGEKEKKKSIVSYLILKKKSCFIRF
ncbi:MAG: hypothetical protein M1829_005973 [Trizodia sp. TS-e1964]|nr:MAG: hypothetical protein M1829_005973 [Trizodia sp. TS-e1964]